MDAHAFLGALTITLCTAGITTVLFQRLHQPVVLGYILAGLIVGPHVPIPLVADPQVIRTLSELGVILLMFSLGLEFSLAKLARVGPSAAFTALLESSLMLWLGFTVAEAFGWSTQESLFTGALVAISSTTIIAKAFDERGIKGSLRELVVAVLIVEDLIAILLMAVLTALSSGDGLGPGVLLRSSGRLAAFLAALLAVGLLVVPRLMRSIVRLERPETTLVATVALSFASALLAHEFGYSVALGAFIAGSLVAESGEERRVAPLILPVRDMFAAIFFVSVGMQIDPEVLIRHWKAVTALTLVVILGKGIGVTLGAFLAGNGTRTSVRAGMSLAQIGEFSFIIAGLGLALGVVGDFLYPVAAAVSALTALTTPWLIRASGPVASLIDRKLPHALQTFAVLYGAWVEQLRTAPRAVTSGRAARRLVLLLLLDATLLGVLVIGATFYADRVSGWASSRLGLPIVMSRTLTLLAVVALALPFVLGVVRIARGLGGALAEAVMPGSGARSVDLAAVPRRMLVVTLQLAVVLAVGLPLLVLFQPFAPGWLVGSALAALLTSLGVLFWRSATSLQGHVTAGAAMIVEALAAQARGRAPAPRADALEQIGELLPGLGRPVSLRLDRRSPAVGKTLAQLDVRGLTGASVLAIVRGEQGVIIPTAREALRAGDVLALAGAHDAVEAAAELLRGTGDPGA